MPFKDILYEVNDHVALITLNKPEKLNAMTWGSWAELETAMKGAEDDDGVRCIVITGAGRGFCAGTDLTSGETETEWHPRPFSGRDEQMRSRFLVTEQVYHCRKPTIAAVNGASTGAGFSLALATDIRIASEAARFSAIFVKRAIVADTGSTWFLPRIVGMEQALKLLYTGRLVPAHEALAMGLVSEVVPADQLMARAMELASEIAHGPSVAIELMKRLAHEAWDTDLKTQVEHEQMLQGITSRTEDAKEGRLSFLEKREPRFLGR
ncbi:MAG TPA: enoyl-CoA hydratase-related protein [Tepidiformaceae bacterium]|nr:enoyl-CoA hydratase-related protein [Tepidiformaceae bacterium]